MPSANTTERPPGHRPKDRHQESTRPATIAAAGAITAALIGVVGALIIAGVWPPHHHRPAGAIESPAAGSRVPREFAVAGSLSNIPGDDHLWLAVQAGNLLYPKEPEVGPSSDHFSEQVVEGGNPPGGAFSLVLLEVGAAGQATVERWLSALRAGDEPPGLRSIPGATTLDAVSNLRLEG